MLLPLINVADMKIRRETQPALSEKEPGAAAAATTNFIIKEFHHELSLA